MTSQWEAVRALGGPIFVVFWGMVLLLMDLGSAASGNRRSLLPAFAIGGLIVGAILSVTGSAMGQMAASYGNVEPTVYFGGGMVADGFGALLCVIVCIVASLAALMSGRYLAEKAINQGEFYSLLLFATAGAMLMALSFDLVNVFVGLEVLSVALYILSGFARRERRSEEAAVKYFLLGAFASGFLLFGTSLVFGAVGMAVQNQPSLVGLTGHSFTNLYTIGETLRATQATSTPLLTSPIFVAGVGMLIVGLGFKAAIVPFHSYAPDVYEGAPTPVTAFMSVAAKVGAFAALIRLVTALTGAGSIGPFHDVIWGLAAATMLVGNILAVRQTNIKRMLAYSSIAHAGYILVGVLASASSDAAAAAMASSSIRYYLFAYTFMNLGAFGIVIWLGRKGHGEYLSIREYDGLAKRNPLAAAAMTVVMLSLSGIPPTAGFVGKLYLFLSAIHAGEGLLAVIGLVVSAIGVFYYLNIIVAMYFREPKHDFEDPRAGGAMAAALIAAVAIVIFGIAPRLSGAFVPTFIEESVKSVAPAVAPAIAPVAPEATPTPAEPSPSATPSADAVPSPEALPAVPTPDKSATPSTTPSADALSPTTPITTAPDAAALPTASPSAAPATATPAAPAPPVSRP